MSATRIYIDTVTAVWGDLNDLLVVDLGFNVDFPDEGSDADIIAFAKENGDPLV